MNVLKQENFVRCVLPGVPLPLGKTGDYLVHYFKENYNINIEYLDAAKTLSGYGARGGRIDQIFNVKEDSIDTFDRIKSEIGALYAKEVVRNKAHHFYMERVYLRYFKRIEDELLKAGEISDEDVYQTL
ncbi:hypothetical protein FH966_01940 [Lentibacillus cibarius]|uniref:Uncharacterized protein n=1 Tax=Lentibacillus cibarius TaxID=2583219 RepID=A0A549YFB1_9BACI|nr:hypothetical protein [Lentibacillus cibarius]TRM10579.1 hypothetical protein FH966_01940 [Lentibacillus cibarius]